MAKNYRDNFDYSEAIANSTSKAERDRWARLIGDFFDSERSFNLVVSLVDIRHDPSKLDLQMIEFLRENGFNFIVCLTKADKLSKSQQGKQAASIRRSASPPIASSSRAANPAWASTASSRPSSISAWMTRARTRPPSTS